MDNDNQQREYEHFNNEVYAYHHRIAQGVDVNHAYADHRSITHNFSEDRHNTRYQRRRGSILGVDGIQTRPTENDHPQKKITIEPNKK